MQISLSQLRFASHAHIGQPVTKVKTQKSFRVFAVYYIVSHITDQLTSYSTVLTEQALQEFRCAGQARTTVRYLVLAHPTEVPGRKVALQHP